MQETNFERTLVRKKRSKLHFIPVFFIWNVTFCFFYQKEKMEATCQGTKKLMGRMCSWRNNFKCPHMVYFFSCNFLPLKQQWSWNLTQKKKFPLYIYHYVHTVVISKLWTKKELGARKSKFDWLDFINQGPKFWGFKV